MNRPEGPEAKPVPHCTCDRCIALYPDEPGPLPDQAGTTSAPTKQERSMNRNAELREAAGRLQDSLSRFQWFYAVGIAGETGELVVYGSRNHRQVQPDLPEHWEGFPIIYRQIAPPIPHAEAPQRRRSKPCRNGKPPR